MTPNPNRQAVYVGLFVTLGITILAGGILTIGDINDTFTHKVTVTAVFDEVGGLQRGDNVWFSGVKVGVVRALGFRDGAEVEVEMRIDEEATRFIRADCLAKIGSDGLIGNRIVVLYEGTPGTRDLQDGDALAVGEDVSTEEMMKTLQVSNTNLLSITTDLRAITGKLAAGEGTIGALLLDDRLHTRALDTVEVLQGASRSAATLTASLSDFTGKLNRAGGLPDDLVTDTTTYAKLTAAVDSFGSTGRRASDLVDGLASGAADRGTPVGALMGDREAGADLKATLDNLHRGSALLNEDLTALQDNFLLRRYFRKQAKAKAKADAAAP